MSINEELHMEECFKKLLIISDSYECVENKLLPSITQLYIPCIHRIQLGAAFPDLPPLHLNVTQQWRDLHVEFELLERENHQPIDDPDYYDKAYIKAQVRRSTLYKDKDEISRFAENAYKSDASAFVNSYPISVIQTINDGLTHFSKLKYENKLKLE